MKTREGKGRRRGKEHVADGPTDAFPRFFAETCARRGERVEKFSCRLGGAAKNCPTIQDSAGNRRAAAIPREG